VALERLFRSGEMAVVAGSWVILAEESNQEKLRERRAGQGASLPRPCPHPPVCRYIHSLWESIRKTGSGSSMGLQSPFLTMPSGQSTILLCSLANGWRGGQDHLSKRLQYY
jgi:hypothetical protein